MATAFPLPVPANASYQTVPLETYSQAHQDLAHRLYERVIEILRSDQPKRYKGSYSVLASTSSATAAKIIIYEDGKGKTNGNWPYLQDGVYALIRANDEIGDRIWNELLPPRLPAELGNTTRDRTIAVAPSHSERFAYVPVTDDNLEAVGRYFAICALT